MTASVEQVLADSLQAAMVTTIVTTSRSTSSTVRCCGADWFVYTGIGADAHLLVRRARKQCEVYRRGCDETMGTNLLSKRLGSIARDFTQSGGVRSFGVSLLIAVGVEGERHRQEPEQRKAESLFIQCDSLTAQAQINSSKL